MKESVTKTIIAIATIIGLAFGAYRFIENRYALADNMKMVELRLDQKIESDLLSSLQDRLWKLEDRCKKADCSPEEWREYRDLREKVETQKKKLDLIQERIIR